MTAGELALRELRIARDRGEPILAVHYACEDLYQAKDRPAAVACIAVVDDADESSIAFSLSDPPPSIEGPEREVDLLRRFYRHLECRPDARIVHWNMNSATYGFAALANRYRYLTANEAPYEPSSDRLFDLDSIIADQYGELYAKHPKWSALEVLRGLTVRMSRAVRDQGLALVTWRSQTRSKTSSVLPLNQIWSS